MRSLSKKEFEDKIDSLLAIRGSCFSSPKFSELKSKLQYLRFNDIMFNEFLESIDDYDTLSGRKKVMFYVLNNADKSYKWLRENIIVDGLDIRFSLQILYDNYIQRLQDYYTETYKISDDTPLKYINLGNHVFGCCCRDGLESVGDILSIYRQSGVAGLKKIKSLGSKGINTLLEKLGVDATVSSSAITVSSKARRYDKAVNYLSSGGTSIEVLSEILTGLA